MGLSGISPGSLLLILFIAILFFGTDKIKNIGTDLGAAVKGFRKAMQEDDVEEKNNDKKLP